MADGAGGARQGQGGGRGGGQGQGRGGRGGRKTRAAFGAKLSGADGDAAPAGALAPAVASTSTALSPPAALSTGKGASPSPTTTDQPLPVVALPSGSTTPGEAEDEQELCFICAEPIKCYALGVCSHRVCHVCSIRLRALYKKTRCTFCQTDCSSVIFTSDPTAPFESFPPSSLPYSDSKLSISCETREQLDALLSLLRFNCPHSACDVVSSGWADLKRHTRAVHGLVLCELCTKNKKIFAHEHTLFTPAGLQIHIREGEVGAGKGEEGGGAGREGGEGFSGHPKCDFCGINFYDADELYTHCRDRHEQCFICTRNGTGRWQYYLDYNALESHFRQAHFLCPSSSCLQQRFVVFEHPFELQAHQVSEHGAELGKGAMQAARRIETNFSYGNEEASTSSGHGARAGEGVRGGRGGRRGGRGGLPAGAMSITPVGSLASANTTNGERTVPGLGPRRPDRAGFGANLTTDAPEAAATPAASGSAAPTAEQERHAALMARVRAAVKGSDAKMASFKAAVRTYRSSEMSVEDFVDTLRAIFEDSVDPLDSASDIVPTLAELLDNEEKRIELLRTWQNSDRSAFPSLGNRTPAPNRTRRTAVWARVEAAANSRPLPAPARQPFPALSQAPNRHQVPGLMPRAAAPKGVPRTAWSAAASSHSSASSSARASPVPHSSTPAASSSSTPRYSAVPPIRTSEANFPSLPTNTSAADRQARARAALTKGPRRVDLPSPPALGQWGPPPTVDAVAAQMANVEVGGGAGEVRTGKKPKKVLLYSNSVR